ncbi:MAG: endonuclease, partial [Pseudomonadales bacterium]|nr:endonuclease [Pseudomonadales bacterium]
HQLWWIIPYTVVFPCEVKPAGGRAQNIDQRDQHILRILTANVLTPNRNAGELIKQVRETSPDILVTLESDSWWQNQLEALETQYSYTIRCPLDNLYGMHVYSRLPLSDCHIEFLIEHDVPSMHALVELRSGQQVRTHFLHPAPPSPTENEDSSERDAELIIVAQSIAGSDEPIVVTGDLNDVAWSASTRLFRKISGLLDPRVGRGMFNTFHADYWFMRWPLDHLFHSNHFTVADIRRLDYFGSDHFPLLTELEYCPAQAQCNDARLDNDAADREQARKTAARKDASASDVPSPGE